MECYYDQDEGVAGNIPEFGAIFMSNLLTKKECFKRKIFALPSSKAEFVKHVKAGMVLFLFESKRRQLFGVFQASSDGAMDIVPHAFSYSGRHFPAQVCFTLIWYCDPLCEREFQDAIRENYFSAKKFNFGLSENQVRRLLSLFSSRKMKKELAPQPLTEAVIGVACKDRRSSDGSFELSDRSYLEPTTETDEFNHAVFSDYHVNTPVKEDDVLIDDRANTGGKVYPLVQGDFLSKRRRIDNDDRLLANDVSEVVSYGDLDTFHTDSSRDSLDELRKSAAVRQLLTAERVRKENQVDKIRHAIMSEPVMDPWDVRTDDNDWFKQRNRLFDLYTEDSGISTELYEKPLYTSSHAIDDARFLFDDRVQRNQDIRNVVEPRVCSDNNLNLCRRVMQGIEDQQCLFNRTLENRYHLDRDVSPFSAFEHNTGLHKTRKSTSGGRFPVNDGMECEPRSLEDLSSANFSRPLHCGHRTISGRKYPIVEGRVTENIRNTGYYESVSGRVVDDRRFRENEGVDNQNDNRTRFGTGISLGHPSSFNQKWTFSPFSDKLLPENGPSQLHVAQNLGPSRASFDDATMTRSTPYSPEHPYFFHGFNAPIAASQNCGVMRENPHHGSPEDSYSCKNRSAPCKLESEKSSTSLDIPPEFGSKGLPTNISSVHQSSLRHGATSSSRNSDLSMHLDLNTSRLVNYRGSGTLARPVADLENIEEEGQGALFDYPSNSSGNHFVYDENLATASRRTSKHVFQHEMDMLSGKDFRSSEAKDSTLGIHHRERDLTGYENQYFGIPNNKNRQVNHEIYDAPYSDSNVNRKSVFSRLTSREKFQGAEERNDRSDFDRHDHYMDATADEVMEMLRQSNNPSPRKLKKSRVVGQSKHGESTFSEKQVGRQEDKALPIEIKSSARENKNVKDAPATIEEPKETRVMDYKRRSETTKNSIEAGTDSATCKKIIDPHEEVGNSRKTTLKRRRLVRPVFGNAEPATDTICSNKEKSQVPGQILENDEKQDCEKAVSLCEPNGSTGLNYASVLRTHQSMDCNINEHPSVEEQKDIAVHVLPSSRTELKENKTSVVDSVHSDKRDRGKAIGICEAEIPNDDCNTKEHSSPEKQKDIAVHLLPSSRTELKEHKTSLVGVHIDKSDRHEDTSICESESQNDNTRLTHVLVSHTHHFMDCNTKEHLSPEELKDIAVHVLPSSRSELKEHETSIVGVHVDKSDCQKTTSICESETHKDNTRLTDVLVSRTHHFADCNTKDHSGPEEPKDIAACVLPSSRSELKEHETSIVGVHIDKSDCQKATSICESETHKDNTMLTDVLVSRTHHIADCNTKEHSGPEEPKDIASHVLPSSRSELKEHKTPIAGVHIGKSDRQKATNICEPETHKDNTTLTDMLLSCTRNFVDCNTTEHSSPEEPKDIAVHVLPSSKSEVKVHKTSIVGVQIDKRDCQKATRICESGTQNDSNSLNDMLVLHTHQSMDCNTNEHSSPEEQNDVAVHVLSFSRSELKEHKTSSVGVHIDKRDCQIATSICQSETHEDNARLNDVLVSPNHEFMGCNTKEHLGPEVQKDIAVHVLPSSGTELKEQEISIVGLHIDKSQAAPLTETTQHERIGSQTFVGNILSGNVDSTTRSLNIEESSSSVGLELAAGCLNNVAEEKRPRMVKRKKKIIKRVIKKVIKTNKTCTEPSR